MDYIARKFWRITKSSQAYMAERLKEFGIGTGQYPLLGFLYSKQNLNQDKIAVILGVDKASVTKAVRKLLKTGFIARKPDAKDKRMYRITLTEKALNYRDKLLGIEDDWQKILLNGFLPEEKKILEGILGKIRENLIHFKTESSKNY
jgi:DNA-binding MarR family transcriptional regulator